MPGAAASRPISAVSNRVLARHATGNHGDIPTGHLVRSSTHEPCRRRCSLATEAAHEPPALGQTELVTPSSSVSPSSLARIPRSGTQSGVERRPGLCLVGWRRWRNGRERRGAARRDPATEPYRARTLASDRSDVECSARQGVSGRVSGRKPLSRLGCNCRRQPPPPTSPLVGRIPHCCLQLFTATSQAT